MSAATAINPGVRAALDWIASLPPHPAGQRHLRLDSRTVRPGDVFVAVAGGTSDGRQHLGDAMARGAAGALVDADGWNGAAGSVPLRAVPHLRRQLGALAAEYYGRPSEATDLGRGDRNQWQDLVQPMDRAGADARRTPVRGHRHRRHRLSRSAGSQRPDHARSGLAAAGSAPAARCRRAGTRDGSLVDRSRPGSRRGYALRRRALHEPHARPSRLPPNDAAVRGGQVRAVRLARPAVCRDQPRRRGGLSLCRAGTRPGCRSHRLQRAR